MHPSTTRLITARRTKRPIKKVSTICGEQGKKKKPHTLQPRSAPGVWKEHATSWKRGLCKKSPRGRKNFGVPPAFSPRFSFLTRVLSVGNGVCDKCFEK